MTSRPGGTLLYKVNAWLNAYLSSLMLTDTYNSFLILQHENYLQDSITCSIEFEFIERPKKQFVSLSFQSITSFSIARTTDCQENEMPKEQTALIS